MMSRAERTLVGDWWWTVDRAMLAGLATLMVTGLVLLMAGGPPAAERLGLSTFHFVSRQVLYLAPAVALMMAVSFLSVRHVRRLALLTYAIGMALVFAALQWGPEIKGAHRWISIAGIGLQPSEFVKPAFVVLAAWAFAEGARRRDMPGAFLALMLLPATIVPLILQPDFGQTMLITSCGAGSSSSQACTGSGSWVSAAAARSASGRPIVSCRMSATASSASCTRPWATTAARMEQNR